MTISGCCLPAEAMVASAMLTADALTFLCADVDSVPTALFPQCQEISPDC